MYLYLILRGESSMKKTRKVFVVAVMVLMAFVSCINVSAGTKSGSKKYELKLNKTIFTMKKGKSVKLKAALNKAAKGKKVEWASSSKKIAEVKPNGKVTAKKKGKATITAKIKGTNVKANCKITVGTPVKSVQLEKSSVSLEPGATFVLKAKLSPKKPSNKKMTFTSNNNQIVSVSSKGVVSAKKEGTAKITVAPQDSSGKKAVCNVTVSKKEIVITNLTINAVNTTLEPGEKKQLTASINPSNATNKSVSWSSSNPKVVTVSNNGLLQGIGEGTATVSVAAKNGVKAACSVKVSYKGNVSSQTELNRALSSKMLTNIVYTSSKAENITIPAGDYSSKSLEIHAPNAEVTNQGRFAKVKIYAIAKNTYTENANNVIEFHASKGHVVVGETGIASIHLSSSGGQNFELDNNGSVRDLQVPAKSVLNIAGKNVVPVSLRMGAGGSKIVTKTELSIRSSAQWDMTVLPGAEHTKATIEDSSCMPEIEGIGCIPVTVSEDQDIVHVPAKMNESIGISQKVTVSGNIQEYDLIEETLDTQEEFDGEADNSYRVTNQASDKAAVYLLPYSLSNRDMNTENYKDYLKEMDASALTDETGNYTIPEVLIGNYWLIVIKDHYKPVIQNLFITSFQTETFANNQIDLLADTFSEIPNTPEISGTIVDGLTGESVNTAGITVKLRAGSSNIIGEAVQTSVTDEEGGYQFTDVSAGVYTVEALDVRADLPGDAVRYNHTYSTIVVAAPYLSHDNYNLIMNQQMQNITGTGLVQFTLEWGTEESGASADIDSHLIGPKKDGNDVFHVYYDNDQYNVWDDSESEYIRYADLDVDDTEYEGPEHTTIYNETPGIYRFYIHNFSEKEEENSDKMAKSSIKVTITIGTSAYTYYCPNQAGNLWYVCDYNSITHTIIPKNIVNTFLGSTSDIGLTEEEINLKYLESEKKLAIEIADNIKAYLRRFNDSVKKTEYLNQVSVWKNQISGMENVNEVRELSLEIEELYDMLKRGSINPSVTADNLFDYDVDTAIDDETGESYKEIICETLSGDTLINFNVLDDGENTCTIETITDDTSKYRYILHMEYANGLSCDYRVRVINGLDSIAAKIQKYVRICNDILDTFEDCEDIQNSRAELTELQNKVPEITSLDEYEEIRRQILEITNRYKYEIVIDSVRAEGLIDWWGTMDSEMDENGDIIREVSVLWLERSEDVTEDEILDKLEISFEDYDSEEPENQITYSITKLEQDSDYYAVLKITNPATGHRKNMYIKIRVY